MSDIPGGGPVDRPRPDDEPTINEAGTDGFVVDGTDSFAVPGPSDVDPADDAPAPAAVSRTRLLVTAGTVAAVLVFVVAVGRGGAGDAGTSLRSEDTDEVGLAFSQWGADDGDVAVVVPDPADEDTLRRLEAGEVAGDDGTQATLIPDDPDAAGEYEYEEYDGYDDVPFPSYPDYDPDDDPDFPSYDAPRRTTTSPRRLPVITVPRARSSQTVSTTTSTTEPAAETTTTPLPEETTTTSSSTPTTTTTTTVPAPGPAWVAAAVGLPDCPAALHVWARGDGLVAAAGGALYELVGDSWRPLGVAIPGAAEIRAFVAGTGSVYWVGTDVGAFTTTDNGATYAERGDLTDVQALAVSPDASSLLAVTGTDQLQRWDGATGSWIAVTVPAPDATFGAVLFVDDTHAVLGTSAGVVRGGSDGAGWVSVSAEPVVGRPVAGQNTLYWMRPGGAGVLRSTALDGLVWTAYGGDGALAADATALAVRPDQVLAWGDPAGGAARLVASRDGGASWVPVEPTTPYRPDGLVHAGAATYAFSADCAAGAPGGADSVVRLVDP